MWWISEKLRRWDLGLSIFFIVLTILTLLYFHRIDAYEQVPCASWWCHVDTPHGHIDQERERKSNRPRIVKDPKYQPAKPPRSKK